MSSLAERITAATHCHVAKCEHTEALEVAAKTAKSDKVAAKAAYFATGAAKDRDAFKNAELAEERAEGLLEQARKDQARARGELTVVETEAKNLLMRAQIEKVKGWPARVAPHIAALVDLDRRAETVAEKIVSEIIGAEDEWREAKHLAAELGLQAEFARSVVKPSSRSARLLCAVSVQRSRDAEGREGAEAWISGGHEPDWKSEAATAYNEALETIRKGTVT